MTASLGRAGALPTPSAWQAALPKSPDWRERRVEYSKSLEYSSGGANRLLWQMSDLCFQEG